MKTIPRREFLRMKGEGHLGEKRDKTVYFTHLWGKGIYIFAVQLGSCLFVCLFGC